MEDDRRVEPSLLEDDEAAFWMAGEGAEGGSLVELINRVLDKGVVITGDVTISIAGVDLVYLGLNAVLTSVTTARRTIDARVGPVREPRPAEGE